MSEFAEQVQQMLPALAAPFETVHPSVNITAPVWAANASGIRARAWRNESCVYLVVVNANEDSAADFGPSVTPAPLGQNATRLFDAKYSVQVSASGFVQDHIEAGGVNIYSCGVGCPALSMKPG